MKIFRENSICSSNEELIEKIEEKLQNWDGSCFDCFNNEYCDTFRMNGEEYCFRVYAHFEGEENPILCFGEDVEVKRIG